jgi:hypothetical protein
MDLSTTQQILLVILSSALAIFLILSIVVVVMVIRILKKVRIIVDKAEKIIESAEAVGEVFKKTATPVGILHLVQNIVGMVSNKRKKED